MSTSEDVRNNILANHKASRKANRASRFMQDGPTYSKTKLSSKNFDKAMRLRGLSKDDIAKLKASSKPGTMQARHAKAGEQFITTHGTERSSGVFVSEKSLGKTPDERIKKGALPPSNSAKYETRVELARDQDLIYGKIAAQPQFSKADPAGRPRSGGGTQVITDGGYRSGAVVNKDPRYPVPANTAFKAKVAASKSQSQPSQTCSVFRAKAATLKSQSQPSQTGSAGKARGNGKRHGQAM